MNPTATVDFARAKKLHTELKKASMNFEKTKIAWKNFDKTMETKVFKPEIKVKNLQKPQKELIYSLGCIKKIVKMQKIIIKEILKLFH